MDRVTEAREAAQPIREKTSGSTFKNPPGGKAWKLIDAAGCRGLLVGDAQVSEMHCNFLINRGGATAADIEGLGEEVRRRVREHSGCELEWEIKRSGSRGEGSRRHPPGRGGWLVPGRHKGKPQAGTNTRPSPGASPSRACCRTILRPARWTAS
jgi:hypothetical protein